MYHISRSVAPMSRSVTSIERPIMAASDRSFQFAVGMPQDLDTKGISGFAVGGSHKEVSQVKLATAEVNSRSVYMRT